MTQEMSLQRHRMNKLTVSMNKLDNKSNKRTEYLKTLADTINVQAITEDKLSRESDNTGARNFCLQRTRKPIWTRGTCKGHHHE